MTALYGVRLEIDNGVENWVIHAMIQGGEGFFIESSAGLMTLEQADRVVELVKQTPFFSPYWDTIKICKLLDT